MRNFAVKEKAGRAHLPRKVNVLELAEVQKSGGPLEALHPVCTVSVNIEMTPRLSPYDFIIRFPI
jgi:hypothetical protein